MENTRYCSYLKLNNDPDSREALIKFFEDNGFEITNNDNGNIRKFTAKKNDLTLMIIWFRNLSHVRVGSWGGCFIENSFDEIHGAITQNVGHNTYSFLNKGEVTLQLSVGREQE